MKISMHYNYPKVASIYIYITRLIQGFVTNYPWYTWMGTHSTTNVGCEEDNPHLCTPYLGIYHGKQILIDQVNSLP